MGVPALVGPELNSDENANYASLLLNLIARGFTGPVSFFLPLSRSTGRKEADHWYNKNINTGTEASGRYGESQ